MDIDELNDEVLYKLLSFVKKQAPRPEDKVGSANNTTAPAAARPKKNKPMNKAEQEAQIEMLRKTRETLSGLHENVASGIDSPGDCKSSWLRGSGLDS